MIKRIMTLLLGIMLCFCVAIPAAAARVPIKTAGTDFPEATDAVFLVGTDNNAYIEYPDSITAGTITFVFNADGDIFNDASSSSQVVKYSNGKSEKAIDSAKLKNEDGTYKTLVAYDPTNRNNAAFKPSGIVDFWPKHVDVKYTKSTEALNPGDEIEVTAEIVNAKGQKNTACKAKYTLTVTGPDGPKDYTSEETTDGKCVWSNVKLETPGDYTIECKAQATNSLMSEYVDLQPSTKQSVNVETITTPDAEEPTTPGSTTTVPENGDLSGVTATIPISSDPAYKDRPVRISFDGGKTWHNATLNSNGALELTGTELTEFVQNGGSLMLEGDASGNYGPITRQTIDWAKKYLVNDGVAPALTEVNFVEETEKDAGGKITGVTDKMEYSTDGGKSWTTCANGEQPITAGVTVWVRYKAADGKLPSSWVEGYIKAMDTKTVTIVTPRNGAVIQTSKYPESSGTVIVPLGDTATFRLVGDKGYEPRKAEVTGIPDDNWTYDKKTGVCEIKVTENCTLTAKFSGIDSGGDFIPGIGDSTGTTGNQPTTSATGVTGNIWGPLLGGTGGTTAQSGAQTVGGFSDVPKSAYFAEAVLWAVNNDITNGTSATTFSPNASCTRAQMVTFLWRQAGSPEPSAANNPFTDVTADQYYYKAVLWAVGKGITNGTSATTFSPNATVTRAQSVTFIWRNAGKPNAGTGKTFADVAAGPYSDAITWAAARGVTQGTSATTFSPSNPCTRGQIVTFMYRAI